MDDPKTATELARLDEIGALRALLRAIKNRIFSGLVVALPILITFYILYWIHLFLRENVLDPLATRANALIQSLGPESRVVQISQGLPGWWVEIAAPLVAIVTIAALLYVLGYLVRSRIFKVIDWLLLKVPGVTTIYQAVSSVFQALDSQRPGSTPRFKRVVLVSFPHPGMRSLGMVTNSLRDAATGRTILCVCVLTGVMPPTGFTLFVPEEEVTDLDWTMQQTLQAIVSGGITCPSRIAYYVPAPTQIVLPDGTPAADTIAAPAGPGAVSD